MKRFLFFVFLGGLLAGMVACETDDTVIAAPEPEPEEPVYTGFDGSISGQLLSFRSDEASFIDSTGLEFFSTLPPDSSRAFYSSFAHSPTDSVFFGINKREFVFSGAQPQNEDFFKFFTNDTFNFLTYSDHQIIYDTINPTIPIIDTIDTFTPGIEIVWLDDNGVLWSSAEGPQFSPTFDWETYEELLTVRGFKVFQFTANFTCTLYAKQTGGIKVISEGRFKGRFRHLDL